MAFDLSTARPIEQTGRYGERVDGTMKGDGFFGPLKAADGSIMTELSIGVNIDGKETEIPLITPALSQEEISKLLAGGEPDEAMVQKSVDFAMNRIRAGKSPFAGPGDRQRKTGFDISTARPVEPTAEQPAVGESLLVGAGRGFKNFIEGVQQIGAMGDVGRAKGLDSGGALGVSDLTGQIRRMDPAVQADEIAGAEQRLRQFTEGAAAERQQFRETPAGQSIPGRVGEFVGEAAPSLVVPGSGAATAGQRIGYNVAAGAGLGGLSFAETEQDRAANVAGGAVLGGAVPEAFALGGRGMNVIRSLFGGKTAEMFQRFGGDELSQQALKRIEAANRLGLQLTPAEATGSAALAARQGRVGVTEPGFEVMSNASKVRRSQEQASIVRFLDDLSEDGTSAARNIRDAAKKVISDEERALSEAARPFYQSAYKQSVPDETMQMLLQDPVISKAYASVMANPIYQRELGEAGAASIKTVDIVKRQLDDSIEEASRAGRKNEARILRDAKSSLVAAADEASPDYKQARQIFAADAPSVQAIKESAIGRIANLDESGLKRVSKVIFDPSETDLGQLSRMRDKFMQEDPAAWRRVIRNELERRLDAAKGDRTASTLYDAALRRDRDLQQFLVATKGLPGSRQAIIDMRRAYKDLLNPITAKTAAAQARSSLDVPRSTAEFIFNAVQNAAGGQYDKAAAEIITSPQWHKELSKALAEKTVQSRGMAFAELLGRAAAANQ